MTMVTNVKEPNGTIQSSMGEGEGCKMYETEDDAKCKRAQAIATYMVQRYPHTALFRMATSLAPYAHREYAFVIMKRDTCEGAMRRHLTFESTEALKREIVYLRPHRIELGASWADVPHSAVSHGIVSTPNVAVARELVFDVDMDAYDRNNTHGMPCARRCCNGAASCIACWPVLMIGCHIFSSYILPEFGVHDAAWFFSGRRGMHCWVNDHEMASPLKDERTTWSWMLSPSPADIVSVVEDGTTLSASLMEFLIPQHRGRHDIPNIGIFVSWYMPRHPWCTLSAIEAALRLHPHSGKCCHRFVQSITAALENVESVEMSLAKARSAHPEQDQYFGAHGTVRFTEAPLVAEAFNTICANAVNGSQTPECIVIFHAALLCLLPRMDNPVTTQPNHLLRAPLCVHLDTMRLGVPVLQKNLLQFLTTDAPVLNRETHMFDNEDNAKRAFEEFARWTSKMSMSVT